MRQINVVGKIKLQLFLVSVLPFALFAFNESRADEIPESALVVDYENCLTKAKPGMMDLQKALCLCSVIYMKNNMTLKEYLLLTADMISKMDSSGNISRARVFSIKKFREISSTCLRKIANQMK